MTKWAMLGVMLVALPLPALADDISNTPGVPKDGMPTPVVVTCYAPGAGGTIQGGFVTSKPNREGQTIPHTLDDVRLGQSQYVTLAANQANYDKWYNLGDVSYVSVMDNRQYTLHNVVGYVHDTGSAFNSTGCAKYNTCSVMYQKFDVAYGKFGPGQSVGIVNQSSFCMQKNQTWKQIGGMVGSPTTVTPGAYVQQPIQQPFSLSAPYSTGAGQILSQDYYCVASIEPVIVRPVPAGTPFPGNCYNAPPAGQPFASMPYSQSGTLSQPMQQAFQQQPAQSQPVQIAQQVQGTPTPNPVDLTLSGTSSTAQALFDALRGSKVATSSILQPTAPQNSDTPTTPTPRVNPARNVDVQQIQTFTSVDMPLPPSPESPSGVQTLQQLLTNLKTTLQNMLGYLFSLGSKPSAP